MLEQILESAREKIKVINNSRSLQDAKVEYLGKSSQINQEMKKLTDTLRGNRFVTDIQFKGNKVNRETRQFMQEELRKNQ